MTQTAEQPEAPVQADMFTAAEAAQYLRLRSVRAFNNRRREHGVKGVRFGAGWMYDRETLDALKMRIFGEAKRQTFRRAGTR